MGRTILCNECHSTFDEDILKKKNSENKCLVCGASLDTNHVELPAEKEEKAGWITWYYYKDMDTGCFTLRDVPIDLDVWKDTQLIQEFKAPPRDSSGSSERAKEILRTYVPDAFVYPEKKEPVIRCPRCASREIQLVPRKFSLLTGFATNKFDRMCVMCKKRF